MQETIYLLSPLHKKETMALPMITFTTVAEMIDLSACDTLMFTSKQAVQTANRLNASWKTIPCLAIGSATAKQITDLGGTVMYQPNSFYGERLSQDIIEKFKDKKILYLRPKEISFDAKAFLAKAHIFLEEQIIYATTCIQYEKHDAPKKNAIIIFTSPSTIHCFFKNFTWEESYLAVVIGASTQKHLPNNVRYEVAKEATIDACIAKAKELLTANRL